MDIYHGPDNIYWLFSSSAQAIAAFIGFLAAGFFFIYDKFDKQVEKDETLEDIYTELKSQYFKRLRILFVSTGFSIVLSLTIVYINGFNLGRWNGWFEILVASLNVWTIWKAIAFVVFIIDPNKVKQTANKLIKENKTHFEAVEGQALSLGVYMEKFVKLERKLRGIASHYLIRSNEPSEQNYGRTMPLGELIRQLSDREIITGEEYHQLREVNKVRNLAVHGEDNQIEPRMGEIVDRLTESLHNRFPEDQLE
jgi:hypothetical protein